MADPADNKQPRHGIDQPTFSEPVKIAVLMFVDAVIVAMALWAAILLRYGQLYQDVTHYWWMFPGGALFCVAALYNAGLYRAMVRYIGPSSIIPLIQGITVGAACISLLAWLSGTDGFPRSAPAIFWFMAILLIGGNRLAVRIYFYGFFNDYLNRTPVAIYGAGTSGAHLAVTLLNGRSLIPVAFIDDNRNLQRQTIHGIPVHGAANLPRLADELGIQQILLAMPSASHAERKAVINRLAELPVRVHTIPDLSELLSQNADPDEIREIGIEDLLGRDPVPPDQELLRHDITDKVVMVTGGGGSIGSELARQIIAQQPRRLILLDNAEFSLFNIARELESHGQRVIPLLGDVHRESLLIEIMRRYGVQTVYHCAAYKHVHVVEQNSLEGIRNNVFGTLAAVRAAIAGEVASFIAISTDKAVNPSNVMGASKRLAEMIIQAHAALRSRTTFAMVRFGNVLGSSGSVVPLFREQIARGGPVTVTHKDATRFFMTPSEAAQLVIQAGAMASGGEVFVLDMGEPVSIDELARKMIRLSGRGEQVDVQYTGLRDGEKMREELLLSNAVTGTRHPSILQTREDFLDWQTLAPRLDQLHTAIDNFDFTAVDALLADSVDGFTVASGAADHLRSQEPDHPHTATNVTPLPRRNDAGASPAANPLPRKPR